MASRLVDVESALEMLERNSGRERGFWLPENLIKAAQSLGWTSPTQKPNDGGRDG